MLLAGAGWGRVVLEHPSEHGARTSNDWFRPISITSAGMAARQRCRLVTAPMIAGRTVGLRAADSGTAVGARAHWEHEALRSH